MEVPRVHTRDEGLDLERVARVQIVIEGHDGAAWVNGLERRYIIAVAIDHDARLLSRHREPPCPSWLGEST
jgi:hypothetical protein